MTQKNHLKNPSAAPLLTALRPIRRRLRRNRFWQGAATGLAVGAAAALALAILSFWTPVDHRWLWMVLALPLGALIGGMTNALRPVPQRMAARAADACGLKERAISALEAEGEGDMQALLRQDACQALSRLDPRLIRPGRATKRLIAAAAAIALCGVSFLLPNLRDQEIADRKALRDQLNSGIQRVEATAEEAEKRLSEAQKQELRRLTADLTRELDRSRDTADALVALDRAEQRIENMQQKTVGDAQSQLAQAMADAGWAEAAQALQSGDAADLAQALEDADAEALSAMGEGLGSEAQSLAEAMASAMRGAAGASLSEALSDALQAAQNADGAQSASLSSDSLQAMKSALSQLASSLGAGALSGASNQSTAKGTGSGAGAGGSSGEGTGGGAGRGSTNEDQGGAGGSSSPSGIAKGNDDPEFREGTYETLYDPEHTDVARRDVMTNQNRQGEDSLQIEAGLGKGTLEGDVPWGQVVADYARTESRAAERENLSTQEKQWVKDYFTRLTDQQ